jgi:hypothetical protein
MVAVTAAVIIALCAAATPARGAISSYYGMRCDGELNMIPPAACVWMNIDHTNNRIRVYGEATVGWGTHYVAVRYLRLQKQGSDLAWRDVPGTMLNDLDGWADNRDTAIGVLWNCQGPGSYRALVHFAYMNYWTGEETTVLLRSGSYSYGQVYNC